MKVFKNIYYYSVFLKIFSIMDFYRFLCPSRHTKNNKWKGKWAYAWSSAWIVEAWWRRSGFKKTNTPYGLFTRGRRLLLLFWSLWRRIELTKKTFDSIISTSDIYKKVSITSVKEKIFPVLVNLSKGKKR